MFPTLIAKGISFTARGGRNLLEAVDITVDPGQIHVVVGHSGAGKTVLADIFAGVSKPSTGTMHFQGQLTSLRDEDDAATKSIRYAKQNWDGLSKATVADSLQLEGIPRKFGLVDTHVLLDRAHGQLSMFGLADIDPKSRVCELSPGKQKLLQIAAALAKPAGLLILDDPTAALSDAEAHVLYERLSQLQYAETGVLYFTASAEEALAVGDQISVLRDGRLISTHDPDSVFVPQIAGEMIGRDTSLDPIRPPTAPFPEVALRAEAICVEHFVYALGLKIRRGEMVGLLGLQGAGQSEAVRAIGGAVARTEGEIYLRAAALPTKIKTRDEALSAGVGFVPEPYGLAADNIDLGMSQLVSRPLRSMNAQNPQRGPIAKCLRANCSVLLFDNPTRGLNAACRLEVCQAIQDIADMGIAVIAASTNVEELISFCDRIAIIVDGRILRTVDRSGFSADKLRQALKTRK